MAIPIELKTHMAERMKSTVESLYEHVDNNIGVASKNEGLISEIFSEYVFVVEDDSKPKPVLKHEWKLESNDVLVTNIIHLHRLYNNPDETVRLSNISHNQMALMRFRMLMEAAEELTLPDAEDKVEAMHLKPPPAAAEQHPPQPQPLVAHAPVYNPDNFVPEPKVQQQEPGNLNDVNNEAPAVEPPSSNSIFSIPYEYQPEAYQAPKELLPIRLEHKQKLDIPSNTNGGKVIGKNKNHITLNMNVCNFQIDVDSNAEIHITEGCHDIKINCGKSSEIKIDKKCKGLQIDVSHAQIHIHEGCHDIQINAGSDSKVRIDKKCKNITIHGFDLNYKVDIECENICTNGWHLEDDKKHP